MHSYLLLHSCAGSRVGNNPDHSGGYSRHTPLPEDHWKACLVPLAGPQPAKGATDSDAIQIATIGLVTGISTFPHLAE